MAVDTRDKRGACIGFALPFNIFPNPDGTIAAADRQQTAFLYPGILAASLSLVLGGANTVLQWWYYDDED